MSRKYTPQERQFLDYFHSIDKNAIKKILSEYHSTGPLGYSSTLILSRILTVKEPISSDRELCSSLSISDFLIHVKSAIFINAAASQ